MNPIQDQYWRDVDPDSTITKLEHTYWITKQSVLKKIGKKEDECVVASDAELDAKLELFRSIQDSCSQLHKVIDRYQERLCCVAQEENALGRFLKEAGGGDDSRAGKLMVNAGKSLSYSGKQRLLTRPSLLRLAQEVDTFRSRAVADTLVTLAAMEKNRVEYRAALRWMKDVSRELDPERHLDKYRKVQSQVRRSKVRFEQLKLDCLQKIDLLAAARCNMFSHALVLYHKALLEFCEKAAHAFQTVANTCKGYHHYEFNIVKELKEPSLKLAEQLKSTNEAEGTTDTNENEDKDILLLFDTDYHDEPGTSSKKDDVTLPESDDTDDTVSQLLLDLSPLNLTDDPVSPYHSSFDLGSIKNEANLDSTWESLFDEPQSSQNTQGASCMPSSLLEQLPMWTEPNLLKEPTLPLSKDSASALALNKSDPAKAEDVNKWLNLFAHLDPFADPDAVASTASNRHC